MGLYIKRVSNGWICTEYDVDDETDEMFEETTVYADEAVLGVGAHRSLEAMLTDIFKPYMQHKLAPGLVIGCELQGWAEARDVVVRAGTADSVIRVFDAEEGE